MKKATFFTTPFYRENKLFDLSNEKTNRDNCLYGFFILKKAFKRRGVDLSTQDINPTTESVFAIYTDMPMPLELCSGGRNYFLGLESEVISPNDWVGEKHKYFEKLFTWHDDFVDGKKYFKINFPQKIPTGFDVKKQEKQKFCIMVAGNKLIKHRLELYSERMKAIRWFEENSPAEFDLYGIGWDRWYFSGVFKKLNKLKFLTKLIRPKVPSYRGIAKSKNETLGKYKFAICYENAKNTPGYITEKIFDCFFAGCVPIYLGAPNIAKHIPENTFIDKRNFESYEDLYTYIKGMPEKEYLDYLNAIDSYVQSERIYSFSAECFAETIVNETIGSK